MGTAAVAGCLEMQWLQMLRLLSPLQPYMYIYIYISIYIHSSAKTEALRASTQHHDNLDDDIVVLSATGMFLIYEARKDWAELCS